MENIRYHRNNGYWYMAYCDEVTYTIANGIGTGEYYTEKGNKAVKTSFYFTRKR